MLNKAGQGGASPTKLSISCLTSALQNQYKRQQADYHSSLCVNASSSLPNMGHRYSTTVPLLTFAVLARIAAGAIPSFGLQTASSVRSGLLDSDFLIRGAGPALGPLQDFVSVTADASNKPALAATDTQFRVSTNQVKSRRWFLKHYHPRAAEVVYVTRGRMLARFWFEGKNPRVVRNILRVGDSVVIPQGLVHHVKCVSRVDCTFIGVLNSGDPGTVPVR